MDQTPTAPMTPFGPPSGEPVVELNPTEPLPAEPELVIRSARASEDRWVALSQRVHATTDMLHTHSRSFGLAVLAAFPVGALVFVAIGSIAFAFDDRGFWDEQLHLMSDYWYVFMLVVAAAVPPLFVAIRDDADAAAEFVMARGYWKVLLAAWVVIPVLVAVIVFVTSHLVAVLVTIGIVVGALLLVGITLGGF